MKKLAILALGAMVLAAPLAQAADHADVAADHAAIAKDEAALAKQHSNIATNREQKAEAKRQGDVAAQAKNSVELGANHTAKAAKEVEKHVDEKILEHDKKNLHQ